jgi:hypothetical protein
MTFKYLFQLFKEYNRDLEFSRNSEIKIFNFWPLQKPEDLWFQLFISHRKLLPGRKSVSIYSVFGDRFKMRFDLFRPKIFFTGENTMYRPNYQDHCLIDAQLSLGFEYVDHPRYLRFPLWYLYFIRPWYKLKDIQEWVSEIEEKAHQHSFFERQFCSMVAGHDPSNTRCKVYQLLIRFEEIASGGKFMNNTTQMWDVYQNDKIRFLKDYKFNIAFENSDCDGYVTEKIFHALIAGCIPIYWGSKNKPESDILNQNRILFFDSQNPSFLEQQLLYLNNDEEALKEIYGLPVFNENAAEKIYDSLLSLESRIKDLF